VSDHDPVHSQAAGSWSMLAGFSNPTVMARRGFVRQRNWQTPHCWPGHGPEPPEGGSWEFRAWAEAGTHALHPVPRAQPNHGVQATGVTLRSTPVPDA